MGAGLVWECPRDDFSDASSSRGISYSVGAPPTIVRSSVPADSLTKDPRIDGTK
jgi:hypothetical protein